MGQTGQVKTPTTNKQVLFQKNLEKLALKSPGAQRFCFTGVIDRLVITCRSRLSSSRKTDIQTEEVQTSILTQSRQRLLSLGERQSGSAADKY